MFDVRNKINFIYSNRNKVFHIYIENYKLFYRWHCVNRKYKVISVRIFLYIFYSNITNSGFIDLKAKWEINCS